MKPDKALEMALDAHALESSDKAAEKHGVHRATIDRAKRQVNSDPELREAALLKKKEMAERLHDKRVEVIDMMLDGMKLRLASMEDRDFVGAYKIVTDSHEVALRVIVDGGGLRAANRGTGEPDKQAAPEGQGPIHPARVGFLGPIPNHRTQ